MAELADALDLGSSGATRECSSHFIRTTGEPPEPVRVSHFVEREFFISRVSGASFCLVFTVTVTLHPVRAFVSVWIFCLYLALAVTSFLLGIYTGEPPEPVRVSHFVEREFFISRVSGATFLLALLS